LAEAKPPQPTEKPTDKRVSPIIEISKVSDFEISLLVIERDTAQFKMNVINDLLNKIGEVKGFEEAEWKPEISEQPFLNRRYQTAKGERIGDYEVCFKNENNADEWQHCFNILRQNNATIKHHFSEKSWTHFYWLYEKNDDRFYRKAKSS
jgi:hypothetical protein